MAGTSQSSDIAEKSSKISVPSLDWTKCIFCQKERRNLCLTCPANSKRTDVGCGYNSLSEALERLRSINQLPKTLNIQYFDEGDGIAATCSRNRACWHNKCKSQFLHGTKVGRLVLKCKQDDEPENSTEHVTEYSECDEPKTKILKCTRTASTSAIKSCVDLCYFCEQDGYDLRQVMCFKVDERVRKCAQVIGDSLLIAKLATTGDMIAAEAKYHPVCLLKLYRLAGKMKTPLLDNNLYTDGPSCQIDLESLALAEVIAYIEDIRLTEITPTVFKMSDLCKMYQEHLSQLMVPISSRVNATRLKERLISTMPDLTAISHGRDVYLTFGEHVGLAVHQMSRSKPDEDALHMMHTVKLVRSEMLQYQSNFAGSLSNVNHDKSVPQVLLKLVSMLLEGPGHCTNTYNHSAQSISQLIIFNSVSRRRSQPDEFPKTTFVRHPVNHETPLPIYIGLMLHSATRKKKLVEKCSRLGLSISYDRVMQISNKLANSVCTRYKTNNVVCPNELRHGSFTVAAVDNIDHNLSSTTAASSFHGTAISLMQPLPDNNLINIAHDTLQSNASDFFNASDVSSDIILPAFYSEVLPCILPTTAPVIPALDFDAGKTGTPIEQEMRWLQNISNKIDISNFKSSNEVFDVSWAAFHASSSNSPPVNQPAVLSLLPLFRYSANTVAMIRHAMAIVKHATETVNPQQIPVITCDQPLFALAKQIQWQWPNEYGEDKFVVMMGGMHIEMASLRMLGHWLDGSGWTQCLVHAGVATSGVADSFIHASHIKRTRYAHIVTASALYLCMQSAYKQYCSGCEEEETTKTFDEWCDDRSQTCIQFKYWSTVLQLQLITLSFIRSIRQGDFTLYVEALKWLTPWFFACDQTNYSRWLPVHLRDMLCLNETHPDTYSKFVTGQFTIHRSRRQFSAISIDQAHEQLNSIIKGDGGAIGLTENEFSLNRWCICGPEIMRILLEFEGDSLSKDTDHMDQAPCNQRRFVNDTSKLCQIFLEENPFSEMTIRDLMALDTHMFADEKVNDTVRTAHEIGCSQFQKYVSERLKGPVSIFAPLPRNTLPLFGYTNLRKKSKIQNLKVSELKNDCRLFSRLYIACQTRDGDLDEFFGHENHPYPPSISQQGNLRFGCKSDLVASLSSLTETVSDKASIFADTYILDGAVAVQMLKPGCTGTFDEYREKMFIPYLNMLSRDVGRLDVIFDVYFPDSLKAACRDLRGTGSHTRVTANTRIPRNWADFLHVSNNKSELFNFLADVTHLNVTDKLVLMTRNEDVVCNKADLDLSFISPCNHEEADTRIILHCKHAALCGSRKIAIRTVDTDIIVLAIAFYHKLGIDELWIHFGVGKNVRFIPVHKVADALGPKKSEALLAFHALTGCDTVSYFSGRGKKTAWETWNCYPKLTETLLLLLKTRTEINPDLFSVLHRFIIIMYDRTSDCTDLDIARRQLFTKKSRTMEHLPPTTNAFLHHVKRAVYQAAHCWAQSSNKQLQIVDPAAWGWIKVEGKWSPLWTTIPDAMKACYELIHCFCKKGCTSRCKCVKANFTCTVLCQCNGECSRTID